MQIIYFVSINLELHKELIKNILAVPKHGNLTQELQELLKNST